MNNHYAGGGTPLEHPLIQCFLQAHADMGADPEVWPVHPAGMPVALWTEELGVPWIGGLPCNAMRKHAANEYAQVSGILQSEKFLARLVRGILETHILIPPMSPGSEPLFPKGALVWGIAAGRGMNEEMNISQ